MIKPPGKPRQRQPPPQNDETLPMTMKTHRMRTYWSAEEAQSVITFLAELRDLLWECYRDEIIEMHRKESSNNPTDTEIGGQPFDDEINF
jgi:hypothetical protein